MNRIYTDDVGIDFVIRVLPEDSTETVADATALKVEFLRQDETVPIVRLAAAEGTKQIKYTTVAGDLDVPGNYSVHAIIERGAAIVRGNRFFFEVFDPHEGRAGEAP